MMRHRTFIGLAAVVAVAVAVVVALRVRRPAAAQEAQEDTTTVVAVHVATIVRTTLRGYVAAWGTVEPQQATSSQPPAIARIAPPLAGLLTGVYCAEGQRVRKGAILFQLDSRVADVVGQKAKQAVQYAEQVFERQRKLGPGEGTSQKLYQEAEQGLVAARNDLANAEAQRALLDIQTPLDGTVVRVNAKPGDAVDLTSVLAEVIDLDRLVVSAAVRSVDLPRLKLHQPVELSVGPVSAGSQGLPAPIHRSTVVFIGSEVDIKTDTVLVRVRVPSGSGLRPGQFVSVRITAEEHRDRLAIPIEGLVSDEGGGSAIAIVEGDKAVKRPVKAGLRDGDLVEVEGEGLKEGMTVVAAGAYALPKESRIRQIAG